MDFFHKSFTPTHYLLQSGVLISAAILISGNMRIIRHLTLLALVCATALQSHAVNPYPQLEEKAHRFFAHSEWASAAAICDLMLEEKPEIPSTYGMAIVSNAMRNDTTEQMRLMQGALDHHIPFDSIFSQVKQWSFHLGKSHLYENFLKETRNAYPWMRRTINGNLLKYYTFRRDGAEMVNYSEIMLDGAPDNLDFLHTLALGYMLSGNETAGIDTYSKILASYPDNYEALIAMGNWHAQNGQPQKALEYLDHAYSLRPTPYVARQIKLLSAPGNRPIR